MQIKIESKLIPSPNEFLENEGEQMLIQVTEWRKGYVKENGKVISTQVLKHLPRAGESKERGDKEDVWREAISGRTIKKVDGRRFGMMTQSNASSLQGSKVPINSQRG